MTPNGLNVIATCAYQVFVGALHRGINRSPRVSGFVDANGDYHAASAQAFADACNMDDDTDSS